MAATSRSADSANHKSGKIPSTSTATDFIPSNLDDLVVTKMTKTSKPSCAVKPTIKPPKPSATVRPLNIAECLQAEAENLIKDDSKAKKYAYYLHYIKLYFISNCLFFS